MPNSRLSPPLSGSPRFAKHRSCRHNLRRMGPRPTRCRLARHNHHHLTMMEMEMICGQLHCRTTTMAPCLRHGHKDSTCVTLDPTSRRSPSLSGTRRFVKHRRCRLVLPLTGHQRLRDSQARHRHRHRLTMNKMMINGHHHHRATTMIRGLRHPRHLARHHLHQVRHHRHQGQQTLLTLGATLLRPARKISHLLQRRNTCHLLQRRNTCRRHLSD
jgi:hypothetical protein